MKTNKHPWIRKEIEKLYDVYKNPKATAVVYDDLTIKHHGHPIQFRIGIGIKGQLIDGRVEGIDLNQLRKGLEEQNLRLRDKELFKYFKNYRGMETIAVLFLEQLPLVDFVEVIENNNEKVIIQRQN